MNEARLRELLREVAVPGEERAEQRGLALVEAAFAERAAEAGAQGAAPRRRPVSLPRLAIALALVTLLAALLLSPAGANVRDWVGEVFTSAPKPGPGLAEIPGGGRLLVESAEGPWVVQPDGSRRLLGAYREATWSPRGLFVAAVAGDTLTAVEPDGTPRWSLSGGGPVADPRWSPSGYRIAYRSGGQLRVTAADGTGDRLIDGGVAPVAPTWAPSGLHQLAYVDAGGELRLADTESGRSVGAGIAPPGLIALEWAGDWILQASPTTLGLRPIRRTKLAIAPGVGTARIGLELPPGSEVLDAAFAPDGSRVAAAVRLTRGGRERSAVLLYALDKNAAPRRLLTLPGRLPELTWAPDSQRLLVAWPSADQWLFLPIGGPGRPRALSGIAAAFAPGQAAAPFPRLEGWCCHAR